MSKNCIFPSITVCMNNKNGKTLTSLSSIKIGWKHLFQISCFDWSNNAPSPFTLLNIFECFSLTVKRHNQDCNYLHKVACKICITCTAHQIEGEFRNNDMTLNLYQAQSNKFKSKSTSHIKLYSDIYTIYHMLILLLCWHILYSLPFFLCISFVAVFHNIILHSGLLSCLSVFVRYFYRIISQPYVTDRQIVII